MLRGSFWFSSTQLPHRELTSPGMLSLRSLSAPYASTTCAVGPAHMLKVSAAVWVQPWTSIPGACCRPHQAVDAPQLLHTDVLADTHVAEEADPLVLCHACELVDDILGGAGSSTDSAASCVAGKKGKPVVHLPHLTLVSAWSGATPVLTKPNGDGSRSCAATVNEAVSAEHQLQGSLPSPARAHPTHQQVHPHAITKLLEDLQVHSHPSGDCLCPCVRRQMHASAHTPCPQYRTQLARCQQRTHSGAAAAARMPVWMRAECNERCCCGGP